MELNMENKNEEPTVLIGDQTIKESDLTPEQNHAKAHIQSLRAKISKLEFELNEILPSLRFYEKELLQSVKETADDILDEEAQKAAGES
jgi:hypothetical protein|tara:strand:- start:57 stop:323 length:267 start_codon:yes stop_codon:yes gene_type:complete